MADYWIGGPLPPPEGITFVQGMLALGTNSSGALELFAINGTAGDPGFGTVWHQPQDLSQNENGRPAWMGWGQLAPNPPGVTFNTPLNSPLQSKTLVVATNGGAGQLEVFAIGTDGNPYHIWQDSKAPGGWTTRGWVAMTPPGPKLNCLDVARTDDGRLVVVYFAVDGQAFYDFQTVPARGPWDSETQRPRTVRSFPEGSPTVYSGTLVNFSELGTLWLIALGGEGNSSLFLGEMNYTDDISTAGWGWQNGPYPIAGSFVGLTDTQPPRSAAEAVDLWLAYLTVDQNGNLAAATVDTEFLAVAGPIQNANPPQPAFAPGLVGLLMGIVEGLGVEMESPFQRFQMANAFVVDSATGMSIYTVPMKFTSYAPDTRIVPYPPIYVGLSGGAINAIAVGYGAQGTMEVFALEDKNQCSNWWNVPVP